MLIPVFGSMPLVALPANLVAVPLAAPLTIWGLAAGVVSGLLRHSAPQLAALVQLPTVGLLHAIISVADVASRAAGGRRRPRDLGDRRIRCSRRCGRIGL